MAAPNNIFVDPSIAADSGAGTVGDPYGDLEYALEQVTPNADGDQFNIKAGTTETLEFALDIITDYGTPTEIAPLVFRGYTSAANDGGIGVISGGGSVAILANSTIDYVTFIDLQLTNTGSNAVCQMDRYCGISNCECDNSTSHGILLGNYSYIFNSYIHNIGGVGINAGGVGAYMAYNYCENGTNKFTIAIDFGSPDGGFVGYNVIKIADGTSTGIRLRRGQLAKNNSIYLGTSSGDGIFMSSSTGASVSILNNLIEINHASANGITDSGGRIGGIYGHNAIYAPLGTAFDVDFAMDDRGNNVSLSASPFVNAAGSDFRINPKVGSDLIKAFGWPTSGNRKQLAPVEGIDLGAIQRREWPLTHPGIGGGFRG